MDEPYLSDVYCWQVSGPTLTTLMGILQQVSESLVREADLNEAAGAADTASMCSRERRWLR